MVPLLARVHDDAYWPRYGGAGEDVGPVSGGAGASDALLEPGDRYGLRCYRRAVEALARADDLAAAILTDDGRATDPHPAVTELLTFIADTPYDDHAEQVAALRGHATRRPVTTPAPGRVADVVDHLAGTLDQLAWAAEATDRPVWFADQTANVGAHIDSAAVALIDAIASTEKQPAQPTSCGNGTCGNPARSSAPDAECEACDRYRRRNSRTRPARLIA